MPLPPWLSPFTPEVQEAVLKSLEDDSPRKVACFDADGTLWPFDIGEAFLRWLIAGRLLPAVPDCESLYEEYEARTARDRLDGYTFAVTVMAGIREEELQMWCRQMAAAWPAYRSAMVGLIRGLQESGVETWIVSASHQWIIRATAPYAGIPVDQAYGIRLQVDENGYLTDRPIEPVSCMAGKVALIREVIGVRPVLAFGDSMGDLEMLEYAVHPVVVNTREMAGSSMVRLADERGWAVHLF